MRRKNTMAIDIINEIAEPAALSIEAAARYIGIGRNSMYKLFDQGEVPTIKISRRRLVLRTDLDAYLERQRAKVMR
jgi:excisionase family DNA binding protein